MIDNCIKWIRRNTVSGKGVVITSRQRACYPEVTGYYIPTLLSAGLADLAAQYTRWLLTMQRPDGSFGGANAGPSFAFDTGQVVRGWVEMLDTMPELQAPLRRACDWLIARADPATGRLAVPAPGGAWSLGQRGEVNEAIHLYVLHPLQRAGELLDEPRYREFARKSLAYYLRAANLTDFTAPNALTHFFAYIQEALLEMGCDQEAAEAMSKVAAHQQENGAVPGYSNTRWVCSTGLAQLAKIWFQLGQRERADKALQFLGSLQNSSGGFFGSYGCGADYFPDAEISWAVKYALDACQSRIAAHFDATVSEYRQDISDTDGRVQAMLQHVGDLNGKRVLDAGCGKGRYCALLKKRFPRARITALDISAEMLAHVPAGIEKIRSSILRMPCPDGAYDAVLCVEALEHAVNIPGAVSELCRVLAPGGKLVVIDKNSHKLGQLQIENWEKWFDAAELSRLLNQNGLIVSVGPVGYEQVTVPDGLFLCWSAAKPLLQPKRLPDPAEATCS